MTAPNALPTRTERANHALRNAMTRSRRHIANGDLERAKGTLLAGIKTAEAWTSGTHPLIHRAAPPQ